MALRAYPDQPHPIKDIITGIIARHGGRLAGSWAEEGAQMDIAHRLEAHGAGPVTVQRFRCALWAMFQCLLPSVLLYAASVLLLLIWQTEAARYAAAGLATLGAVLFLTEFVLYRRWLDFLFPKHDSLNVIADAEPIGPVRQTVIFAGHVDSSREFYWWYHLRTFSLVLMFVVGVLMAIAWPIGAWLQALLPGLSLGWLHWAALASLPLTAVFVFIRVGPAVPGAMDNLSGIAIALAAFETLTPNGRSALAHTRLRFISFGSEEAGLRGAEAYVKAHKAQLHAENAVLINIDSVMNTDELKLITSEIMPMVAYDKPHLAAVKRAFAAAQAPFTTEPVPIGGTDAVCFQRAGIPSTTIIGFGTQGLHPAYHTRLDVPQYLDPQALDLVHDVLVAFAHQTDGPAAA